MSSYMLTTDLTVGEVKKNNSDGTVLLFFSGDNSTETYKFSDIISMGTWYELNIQRESIQKIVDLDTPPN